MPKTITQAIAEVEQFLRQYAPPGMAAKVYPYTENEDEHRQRPWCGVLVAEVSFFGDRSGCSFMQVDLPHGLAMCAQVERCLLAVLEDWDADGGTDGQEEFERLAYLLKPPEESHA
jgi:hypothetical protein